MLKERTTSAIVIKKFAGHIFVPSIGGMFVPWPAIGIALVWVWCICCLMCWHSCGCWWVSCTHRAVALVVLAACVLAVFALCWRVSHTCRRWQWCWHVCWRHSHQCWWCWRWPGHSYFMNRLQEGDKQEFHAEQTRVVLVCCCSWHCCHTCWCWHLCWWHSRWWGCCVAHLLCSTS